MGSGFVVHVDESGDHSLTSINPDYPMFVLAFSVFPIDLYVDRIVPMVQRLKFVSHPSAVYPKPEGNGKLCYTAPIVIHDPETKTVSIYNPTVIVSQNRKLVITSFPTNASPNCTGDSAQHARGAVALHLTPRGDHETRSHVRREARADPLR